MLLNKSEITITYQLKSLIVHSLCHEIVLLYILVFDIEHCQNVPLSPNCFGSCPQNNRAPELPLRDVYAKFQIYPVIRSLYIAQISVYIYSDVTLTLDQGHRNIIQKPSPCLVCIHRRYEVSIS